MIPSGAFRLATHAQIDAALDRMAYEIGQRYSDQPLTLLTVMNGGMIPAANLALRLQLPLTMDYLHVSRYRQEQGGDILNWNAHPTSEINGRQILVVDDIFDEGPTLEAIVTYLNKAGATTVATAVLAEKIHDRKRVTLRPDFIGLQVTDHYVFGYGMDYRGSLRHLPDIWALQGS